MNPETSLDSHAANSSAAPPQASASPRSLRFFERAGCAAPGLNGLPHFAPTAKRVIFLHQSGGPSQMDLFDYKPDLQKRRGAELPGSVRMGQRITGMTSGQSRLPVAPSIFKFQQHGKSGAWVSELLPHTAKIVDDLAIIKTMNTDAINHDPAITFIQTGQPAARPAQHGRVGQLRAGQREPQSARVRRDALAGHASTPTSRCSRALGQRLSAVQSSGRALPRGRRSGALSRRPEGHLARARAATCSTASAN